MRSASARDSREAGKRGWIVGGCVRDLLARQDGQRLGHRDRRATRRGDAHLPARDSHRDRARHGDRAGRAACPTRSRRCAARPRTPTGDGPDTVVFVDDITADLARRDFTVNAIAIDPLTPGADRSLRRAEGSRGAGAARGGDPVERFSEDGLRVLRAARFAATLECTIEPPHAWRAIEPTLSTYRKVSAERVRDEWMKAMKARRPSVAFEVMRTDWAFSASPCPEIMASVGCEQNRYHAYDVWTHSMECLDACEGDPPSAHRRAFARHRQSRKHARTSEKTNDYTFYNHEKVGADMAGPILERLRFSNEERGAHHAARAKPSRFATPTIGATPRYEVDKARHPRPRRRSLRLESRRRARQGPRRHLRSRGARELKARVAGVLAAKDALSVRELTVDGKDVMRELAIKPSRRVGEVSKVLLEKVVEIPR